MSPGIQLQGDIIPVYRSVWSPTAWDVQYESVATTLSYFLFWDELESPYLACRLPISYSMLNVFSGMTAGFYFKVIWDWSNFPFLKTCKLKLNFMGRSAPLGLVFLCDASTTDRAQAANTRALSNMRNASALVLALAFLRVCMDHCLPVLL